MTSERRESSRRSLFSLIGTLPTLLTDLLRDEIESLKLEMTGKLKKAGIGIGLLAGAAVLAVFALLVFVTAGILGLATVLPGWLAALIVGVFILIIAAILAALGAKSLKKGVPPAPVETIESIKEDVRTIKGTQRKANS